MKKIFATLLLFLPVVALLATGCSSETPTEVMVPLNPVESVVNAGQYKSYLFASACLAQNGDILVFSRVGNTHAADRGKIIVTRSQDFGETWEDPVTVIEAANYDCRNPICGVLCNGRILLGYAQYDYTGDGNTGPNRVICSDDNGKTWKDLASVPYTTCYFSSAGNIIAMPGTNELLLPCEDTIQSPSRAVFLWSEDEGATWSVRSTLSESDHFFNEPTVALDEDGIIWTVIRDDNTNTYWVAKSTDKANSWSSPIRYPDLKGNQPSLGVVNNRFLLASRRFEIGQPSLIELYNSRDCLVWYGKRVIVRSDKQCHSKDQLIYSPMNYGSFLELGPVTLYFFSMEKATASSGYFFDSGVFYIVLTKDDYVADKSYPTTIVLIARLEADSTSSLSESLTLELRECSNLAITVDVTYHISAKAGIEVNLYSSPDNLHYDSDPFATITPSFSASATIQRTEVINSVPRYLKAVVTNLDDSYVAMDVKVIAVLANE